MDEIPSITNAFLAVKNGFIHSFGRMEDLRLQGKEEVINAHDRFVLPAFVDSHTHLVYAGSRETEFVDKIRGLSYAEIASRGGGILNSAKKLRATSAEELLKEAYARAMEVMTTGTGTVEIKSGYGLDPTNELKILRVIKKLEKDLPLKIKATFLGAHAFPENVSREYYIDQIINEMVPAVAEENLATFIDVFCEEGFFNVEESERILEAGKRYGLQPKVHANQLHVSGGVQLGIKTGAISVDHLESIGREEIEALKKSNVVPTLLPGAAFFLNSKMPPARELIEAGLPVAIASDYNPGSSPSGNMQMMLSLACVLLRMTPNEGLNAMTINGAYAMNTPSGVISQGRPADLIITKKIPSLHFMPYSYGTNNIEKVLLDGMVVADNP